MIELPPVHAAVIREEAALMGLPALLLYALAYGESEFNERGAGDNGSSRGYFQVHVPVHGLPAHGWVGIEGTRAAIRLMGPRWRTTYASLGGDDAFTINPTAFFCRWWPAAQGAVQPEWARCVEAITAAQGIDGAEHGGSVMIDRPAVLWKGAHAGNFTQGRGGVALEAIVIHIAEGPLGAIDAWFNDARAKASTHFAVSKAGRIHQYVKLADMPYANGSIEPGYTAKLIDENAGINPNQWTVSIEHEGFTGEQMTPAMFDASTWLSAWLFETDLFSGGATGVAVDRKHVLGHRDISPRSRPRCPGYPESFFGRYIDRVQTLLAPALPPFVDPRDALLVRYRDALTVTGRDMRQRSTDVLKLADALTRHGAALDQQAATLMQTIQE